MAAMIILTKKMGCIIKIVKFFKGITETIKNEAK